LYQDTAYLIFFLVPTRFVVMTANLPLQNRLGTNVDNTEYPHRRLRHRRTSMFSGLWNGYVNNLQTCYVPWIKVLTARC